MKRYGDFSDDDKRRIVQRVTSLYARFIQFKSGNIPSALRQALRLDVVKLELAVGAYWNDLNRLKQWHDISDKLHRSKVAAYTIRWLLHFSPVYSTLNVAKFRELDEASQTLLLNANCTFSVQTLFFTLDELDVADFQEGARFHPLLRDLLYHMATGGYQERMAALLFDSLVLANTRTQS